MDVLQSSVVMHVGEWSDYVLGRIDDDDTFWRVH